MRKRWADPAFQEKMRIKSTGRMHTEEYKMLMSGLQKAKWARIKADPERYKEVCATISRTNARYMLGRKRELSTNWKGGRIVSKRDGYILVMAPEGHPYAKSGGGGNKGRYILEHRLIMEKVLGRYLLPTEDVNHINGKKDDNRPENLALVRHYAHYQEMQCPKCEFKFRTR